MKLYSKDGVQKLVSSMLERDRLCRSFLLAGDKGIGKKTTAMCMAQAILCRNESAGKRPCCECRDCRMVQNNAHPDVITVAAGGKSGNYRADDLRPLVSDAYVASNEGGYKIYILPDIDKALPAAQNTLLKVFEEPPDYVVIIMTAERRENVLPTVLSRAVVINIPETSEENLIAALAARGYSPADAERAYGFCGGNIGACVDFLEGGSDELYQRVKSAVSSLAKGDEYALMRDLYEPNRAEAIRLAAELSKAISFAVREKQGNQQGKSFYSEEALRLGRTVSLGGLMNMYEVAESTIRNLRANGNSTLLMSNLSAKLMSNRV